MFIFYAWYIVYIFCMEFSRRSLTVGSGAGFFQEYNPQKLFPSAPHPPTHLTTPTAKSVQCAATKCAGKLDSELKEKPHVLGEMQVEPMRNKSLALWRWHV